jgi:glycosyltransferase 2 family protein
MPLFSSSFRSPAVHAMAIRALSALVMLVSAGYIAAALWRNFSALGELALSWRVLGWLGGAALACALSNLFLNGAWGVLLRSFVRDGATAARILAVYGVAQVGKYVPGNFLHYVGRQVLGRRFGWSQSGMALASFGETVTISAVALTVAAVMGGSAAQGLWLFVPAGSGILLAAVAAAACAALATAMLTLLLPASTPGSSWYWGVFSQEFSKH